MTTTIKGNRITGQIGLTCWAEALITEGKLVEVVGDYKVAVPTGVGSAKVIGHVVKGNLGTGVNYELTVEAYGHGVHVGIAGTGGIAAGDLLQVDASGNLVAYTSGASSIAEACVGIALTTAIATAEFDYLTFR